MKNLKKVLSVFSLSIMFFAVFLCFGAVCALGDTSAIDGKIAREEKSMQRLEKQVNYHKQAVAQASKKEESVLQQLSNYDQKRKLTEQRITLLELKQEKVNGTVHDLEEQIANAERDIARMKELLRDRLVSIYKYGGLTEINLLVGARNAHDAMVTSYLLSKVAGQDQSMIEEMSKKKEQLENAAGRLTLEKDTLANQTRELTLQKDFLVKQKSDRNVLLQKLRKEKALHVAAAKDLERSQREIKQKISQLLEKKRRDAASRTSSGRREDITYMKAGGSLLWPVRGKITSSFGTRVHPVFKTKTVHTGIDIAAKKGASVKAAESGEVLYSGWLRGYGQIIIIDHGHGMTTVYAHLDSISVDEGQGVKKGQVVGTVGNTGVATGPHLHFEVRINGDARDPLRYLSK